METKTDEAKWYALRVHSGLEKSIGENIRTASAAPDLKGKILEVLIPIEKQIRRSGSKQIEKEVTLYPGFIFINMVIEPSTRYTIMNMDHVSGFVGSRTQPEAVPEEEIQNIKARMRRDSAKHKVDFELGEMVQVIEGPFADSSGKIVDIDAEKHQASILVHMFGRETPVKIDMYQIRKV